MTTSQITIRKAVRQKAKLRLGIAATSGSGKTYGALLLAFGIGGKIGMIDTEHGSGDLYAHLGDYDIISLKPPFDPKRYIEALRAFEDAGYDTVIIDSLSHAWAGDGGLLDKQGKLEDSGKYRNSFATWREITPQHNALVEAILQSKCHVIATMRSKTEYVLETNDKGKQMPRKVGLAPVMRDGIEYEFTVMLDISDKHYACATKDRTEVFGSDPFKITTESGKKLSDWLSSGAEPEPEKKEPVITEEQKELGIFLTKARKTVESINDGAELDQWCADNLSTLTKLSEKQKVWFDEILSAKKAVLLNGNYQPSTMMAG